LIDPPIKKKLVEQCGGRTRTKRKGVGHEWAWREKRKKVFGFLRNSVAGNTTK